MNKAQIAAATELAESVGIEVVGTESYTVRKAEVEGKPYADLYQTNGWRGTALTVRNPATGRKLTWHLFETFEAFAQEYGQVVGKPEDEPVEETVAPEPEPAVEPEKPKRRTRARKAKQDVGALIEA